jgi:fumarate reductase subunit C
MGRLHFGLYNPTVSTGMSTLTPGRLQFLRSPNFLVLSTVPLSTVLLTMESTWMEMEPSAMRMLFPGFTRRKGTSCI